MKRLPVTAVFLLLSLCAGATLRADDRGTKVDDFKSAFNGMKGTFDTAKGTVDKTAEYFGRFNEAMSQWRRAVSKDIQNDAIESVTELTGEQVENLASALKSATGLPIPSKIPDSVKGKISQKLLNSLPVDKQNMLGYMYTLSAIDKKLQNEGVYSKLSSVKSAFNTGGQYLGNVKKAVAFTEMFNPTTDGSATGSLKKIGTVLGYMGDLTEGLPLMGDIISGYAEVTKGFVGALEDLHAKLKAARMGSLGDDYSTDKGIRVRVEQAYPDIDPLAYETVNMDYPDLAPVRGWKNQMDNHGDVILYYGGADGGGQLAKITDGTFAILYSYHSAMKNSDEDASRKEYDPTMFMNRAASAGSRDYSSSDKKFRDYYAQFEGPQSGDFVKTLRAASRMDKDNYLISTGDQKLGYRLYSRKENEFAGLCAYSGGFRSGVEGLLAKYAGKGVLSVRVSTLRGGPVDGLTVTVNGAEVKNIARGTNGSTFDLDMAKGASYDIEVSAPGYKSFSKKGETENPLVIELETVQQAAVKAVLDGPDDAEAGKPSSFSVDFGTSTELESQCAYLWRAENIQGDAAKRTVTVVFVKPGPQDVAVAVTSVKDLFPAQSLSKKVMVRQAAAGQVSASLDPVKAVYLPGQKETLSVTVKGLAASTFTAAGWSLTEKPSGARLTAPDPFVPLASELVKDGPHTLPYTAPQAAGNYTIVLEAYGKTRDGRQVLLAKDQKSFQVGSAVLAAPDQVKPGEVFEARVNAADTVLANVKNISWDGGNITERDPAGRWVKMKIEATARVTAALTTAAGGQSRLEKEVRCDEPKEAAPAPMPTGWVREWPNLRKTSYLYADVGGSRGAIARVSVDINLAFVDSTDYYDDDHLQIFKDRYARVYGGWPSTQFTSGMMKGIVYDEPPRFTGEYGRNSVASHGQGYCYSDSYIHAFEYDLSGDAGGKYGDWLHKETDALRREIHAVLSQESFSSAPRSRTEAAAKPPEVTLTADKAKLRRGESATLSAAVANIPSGESPVAYQWDGNVGGSGEIATFLATKAGKQTVKVTAKGAKNSLGTASVTIDVGDFDVLLRKDSPATGKIIAGTPVSFSAQVLDKGKALEPSPVLRWQPNTEVKFDPAEGTAAKTSATFNKPGKITVWVEALEDANGILSTLGASDSLELEIVQPEIKLSVAPDKPMVGEPVTLTASSNPPLKEIDYRWDLPKNMKLTGESKDAATVTAFLLDDKEAAVTVNARVPKTGEALGTAQARVTAGLYEVSVTVLPPAGPRPLLWVEGKGLQEAQSGIMTDQNVKLRADIKPEPAKPARWSWKLDEGSSMVSGGASRELTASRNTKGECSATVEAKDADGLLLGKGAGGFAVTISQDDITRSKKKSDARAKLAQAKTQAAQGKLDEAIGLCDEAVALDPAFAEAAALSKQLKANREKITKSLADMRTAIAAKKLDAASKAWSAASAVSAQYAPVLAAKKELGDVLALAEKEKKDTEEAAKLAQAKADKEKADKAAKDKAEKEKTAAAGPAKAAAVPGAATAAAAGKGAVMLGVEEQAAKKKQDEAAKKEAEAQKAAEEDRKVEAKKQTINNEAEKLVIDFTNAVEKGGDKFRDVSKLEQAVAKYEASQAVRKDEQTAQKLAAAKKQLADRAGYIDAVVKYEGLQADAKACADKKDWQGAARKALEAARVYRGPNHDMMMRSIENQIYAYRLDDGNAIRAEADKTLKANDIRGAIAGYEKAHKAYPPSYPFFTQLEVQIGDLKNRVTAAGTWRTDGEKKEKQQNIAAAIASYELSLKQMADDELAAHVAELKKVIASAATAVSAAAAAPQGQGGDADAVRQMYADFARAYESKNESRVISFMAPDWSAGDGTTVSDLRNYLHNSFGVFDEIRYAVSNLTVTKSGEGRYRASYAVKISGRVFENNITHEESSSVDEEVTVDAKGRARITRTGDGKFWVVE